MSFIKTTNKLKNFYYYVFDDIVDRRTVEWFLMSSPLPGIFILVVYLCFVLNFGPKLMKNRKPYDLKLTLKIYNFFQILLSLYIFWISFNIYFVKRLMNFTCTPVDQSLSPDAMYVANGFYLYFISKMTELMDTVFFVLRKKERQVSFLHVYHHTCMCMLSWGGVKYFPGGHAVFLGFINSFVHIIMYTYYFLTSFGNRFQKYLWWKKYITVIQMVQFGLLILHFSLPFYFDCGYPKWVGTIIMLPNCTFFIFLFKDFYRNAYKKHSQTPKKTLLINNNSVKNGTDKKLV